MKPDFDLMRRLMIDIANRPISNDPPHIQYTDCDEKTINWYLAYLIDGNFLKGKVLGSSLAPDHIAVLGITHDGYEFVKAAENDTLWQKLKLYMLQTAVPFTIRTVFEWLKAEAKAKIGIP